MMKEYDVVPVSRMNSDGTTRMVWCMVEKA